MAGYNHAPYRHPLAKSCCKKHSSAILLGLQSKEGKVKTMTSCYHQVHFGPTDFNSKIITANMQWTHKNLFFDYFKCGPTQRDLSYCKCGANCKETALFIAIIQFLPSCQKSVSFWLSQWFQKSSTSPYVQYTVNHIGDMFLAIHIPSKCSWLLLYN